MFPLKNKIYSTDAISKPLLTLSVDSLANIFWLKTTEREWCLFKFKNFSWAVFLEKPRKAPKIWWTTSLLKFKYHPLLIHISYLWHLLFLVRRRFEFESWSLQKRSFQAKILPKRIKMKTIGLIHLLMEACIIILQDHKLLLFGDQNFKKFQ